MKILHTAVSTRKGFNYCVWFGFIVDEKRGKQESLKSLYDYYKCCWSKCFTGTATQHLKGKFSGEAMWFSHEELLSSVKCRTLIT
jgi:hypothetical protein